MIASILKVESDYDAKVPAKEKATLGTDREGTRFFLAGGIADHYNGLGDFSDYVKRFGFSNALSADMQLFGKRLSQRGLETEKKVIGLKSSALVPALVFAGAMGCYSNQADAGLRPHTYETKTYVEGKDTLWVQGLDQDGDGKSDILTVMKIKTDDRGTKILTPYRTISAGNQDFALWETKLRSKN